MKDQSRPVKQHEPVSLELGIRALEHEKLAYASSTLQTVAAMNFDVGYRAGLEHAIQTLRNLDAANQKPRKDPAP